MTAQEALNQIINQYNGKPCESEDPGNLNQCMDLAFKYCDILGINRAAIRHTYAFQVFENPNALTYQYFDVVKNTPLGIPKPGALMVFHKGNIQHISLYIDGGFINFRSFDQNWPLSTVCHIQGHNYFEGVIGWLQPKETSQPLTEREKTIRDWANGSLPDLDVRNKIRGLLNV